RVVDSRLQPAEPSCRGPVDPAERVAPGLVADADDAGRIFVDAVAAAEVPDGARAVEAELGVVVGLAIADGTDRRSARVLLALEEAEEVTRAQARRSEAVVAALHGLQAYRPRELVVPSHRSRPTEVLRPRRSTDRGLHVRGHRPR